MKQIRSGQSFLYRNAGYDSTVIEIHMKDKVTGSFLQVALRDTINRFPYMTDKLVEKDGRYYLHTDLNSMTVNKTNRFRTLGSMSTGYHLLDVTYISNLIRVAFHHGLCDGSGVKPFVETLLYNYCCQKYKRNFSADGIRLSGEAIDEEETAEPFGKEYFSVDESKVQQVNGDGYALPESTSTPENCFRTEYIFDEAAFVGAAKEVNATPTILATMLVSTSMNELCPDALKPIVCNMAMDLRKVIGAEKTHRNCVGTAVFPYGKEEKEMDMAALAVRYRELLNRQRETDYVKAMLNRQMEMFDQLDGIDTLEEKRKMLSFFESMIIHTYVISNLGRLRLNDYAQYVESACFYSDDIRGMTINMLSVGGKLTMEVLQGFPETRYIRSFEKTFKPYGLLKVNETVTVTTGKDKSFLTASHQAERYFVKPE